MQNSFNTSKISFKGPYVVKNDKIIHVTINRIQLVHARDPAIKWFLKYIFGTIERKS